MKVLRFYDFYKKDYVYENIDEYVWNYWDIEIDGVYEIDGACYKDVKHIFDCNVILSKDGRQCVNCNENNKLCTGRENDYYEQKVNDECNYHKKITKKELKYLLA